MAELGFHRNAKKCKEKFENISKYHKRTKECRSSRQNGKHYRFFEQLELLDSQTSSLPSPSQNKIQPRPSETTMPMGMAATATATVTIKPSSFTQDDTIPCSVRNSSAEFVMSTSTSTTSSSGKQSEGSGKKKRKLGDFFETLMKEVLDRQETLQKKFVEALERSEKDRMAREEAWRKQQLERIKREQEMLAQERAVAAARDAAVIAFLQKVSEQTSRGRLSEPPTPTPTPTPLPISTPSEKATDNQENGIADNSPQVSSSRWPKSEVEALIKLRTNLDLQYQDNGPKGPLWEEISSSMKKFGYNRSAKRCKEKWENINKYYKRVKESNRKRPEDSKTCPYFQMLESVYEQKSKKIDNSYASGSNLKPEQILMQLMNQQPQEQQQQEQQQQHNLKTVTADGENENIDQNQEDDGDDGDDEDDDNGSDYQIVANSTCSLANME
ncbi:trihelix transcription factor DF1-like isoform X2 [Diospyros lotus]|nr:trihelix transcription factor DF1-like isoform X2 [Diospyros lotus]